MNIYDYAMKMEKEGELFYRELAQKTENSELKGVLNLLADEEVKHYEYVKAMKEQSTEVQFVDSDILSNAKSVFEQLKQQKIDLSFDTSAVAMYKKASEIEEASYKNYLQQADEASNESQRRLFEKLALEERHHQLLMENFADFVAEPSRYLEDAEWHNWS